MIGVVKDTYQGVARIFQCQRVLLTHICIMFHCCTSWCSVATYCCNQVVVAIKPLQFAIHGSSCPHYWHDGSGP